MNRINLITLGVRHISDAVDFYRKMGFEASIMGHEDAIEIVFFRMNGSKLALYPLEKLAGETGLEAVDTEGRFNGITLAYNAKSKAEVDQVLKRAGEHGGEVISPPAPTEWGGYSGYFADLDGYCWEVAYGADWEFDDNDMLII
ncbi:VOC family protein [Salinicoccus luteus]|uniref:VOC family protein n=1 Tax=Salinicoccus luteus TaxID=367840 RepID=UPI0004E283B3|nr:VOC family protein [Salinicoccus luteus]